MARGDRYTETFHVYTDESTGRTITRLTDPSHHCHHCYFYLNPFMPGDRRMVYVSDRTGRRNLFLLDLQTAESIQLTDCFQLEDFLWTVSKDGRFLLYSEGNQLRKMSLDTFQEQTLYIQTYPWNRRALYPGFNGDLSKMLIAQIHVDDIIMAQNEGWDAFEPQFKAKPRCRLVLVDLTTGSESVVLEERTWLGHPQIRPGDDNTLMYCHEGPWEQVDCRMWLINADGTHRRPVGYCEPYPGAGAGTAVGHEYFTPDGKYIAFAYFPDGHNHRRSQGTIKMRDVETMEEIELGQFSNYNHFISSSDGRYIVGDEIVPDDRSKGRIFLVDMETLTEKPLCRHGSSDTSRINRDTNDFSTQDTHPHPLFSSDSRIIIYSSDQDTQPDTGNCSIFMVETDGVF